MSILIKGMEMPKNCEECRFETALIDLSCSLCSNKKIKPDGLEKRPIWCPLVEVNPAIKLYGEEI